jgi:hypothetical protein
MSSPARGFCGAGSLQACANWAVAIAGRAALFCLAAITTPVPGSSISFSATVSIPLRLTPASYAWTADISARFGTRAGDVDWALSRTFASTLAGRIKADPTGSTR